MGINKHDLEFTRRVEQSLGVLRAVVGFAAFVLILTERSSHLWWEWWIETVSWAAYSVIGVAAFLLVRHATAERRVLGVRRIAVIADASILLVQPVLHVSDGGHLGLSPVLLFPVLLAARYAMRGALTGTAGLALALLATDLFSRATNGWGLDPDDVMVVLLISLSAAVVGGALTRAAAEGRLLAHEEAERARTEAARAERATATMQGVHQVLSSGIAAGVHAACIRMANRIQTVLDASYVTIRLVPDASETTPAVTGGPMVELTSGKVPKHDVVIATVPIHSGRRTIGELEVASVEAIDEHELALFANQVGLAAHAALLLDEEARLAGRYRDLDRLRSDFLALAAHELRTPTAAIHGALSTIASRGGDLSADINRQLLEVAGRQTTRLIQLADDLTAIGRSDHGSIPVRSEAIDVHHVVARAVEAVEDHQLVHLAEGPPCHLLADPARTQQILVSLLENAGRHGLPPVELAWSATRDNVELRVSDLGRITPAEGERIFERFYVGGIEHHTRGSGLGLPLGRDLAHAMGGTLALDADAATTTFVLSLPIAQGVAAADTSPGRAEKPA